MENKEVEKPTVEYQFANKVDEESGIETATYANNNQVKRFTISTGEVVIVRELNGKDMMDIDRFVDKQEEYIPTMLHVAVKIDGKSVPKEMFSQMKGKDYNKIKAQAALLNF
jgi:hypothetical protein